MSQPSHDASNHSFSLGGQDKSLGEASFAPSVAVTGAFTVAGPLVWKAQSEETSKRHRHHHWQFSVNVSKTSLSDNLTL